MLTLVAARARNGAIGRGGAIPWSAPEDLAFFQRETLGGALIMGRRTWDSLPRKPLPRRLNIVVTSRPGDHDVPDDGGAALFPSLDEAVAAAGEAGHARIYGIGGARIYEGLMPQADRLLITEVALDVTGADTFFPAFDPADWHTGLRMTLRDAAPTCVVQEYIRRRA